jgi:hypothetical protein
MVQDALTETDFQVRFLNMDETSIKAIKEKIIPQAPEAVKE